MKLILARESEATSLDSNEITTLFVAPKMNFFLRKKLPPKTLAKFHFFALRRATAAWVWRDRYFLAYIAQKFVGSGKSYGVDSNYGGAIVAPIRALTSNFDAQKAQTSLDPSVCYAIAYQLHFEISKPHKNNFYLESVFKLKTKPEFST